MLDELFLGASPDSTKSTSTTVSIIIFTVGTAVWAHSMRKLQTISFIDQPNSNLK